MERTFHSERSLDHNGRGMTRPRRHGGGHKKDSSIEASTGARQAQGATWVSRLAKVSFEDLDVQFGKKLCWARRPARRLAPVAYPQATD